jgi:hypothetical protein
MFTWEDAIPISITQSFFLLDSFSLLLFYFFVFYSNENVSNMSRPDKRQCQNKEHPAAAASAARLQSLSIDCFSIHVGTSVEASYIHQNKKRDKKEASNQPTINKSGKSN